MKECEVCGEPFEPRKSSAHCCSRRCAAKWGWARVERPVPKQQREAEEARLFRETPRPCPVCGEMFAGSPVQKYCSKACNNKANTLRRAADPERMAKHYERKAEWQRANADKAKAYTRNAQTEVRECTECGTKFMAVSAYGKTACSKSCAHHAKRGVWPSRTVPFMRARMQMSPLNLAITDRDAESMVSALQERTTQTVGGCWIWDGSLDSDGYPNHKVGKRARSLWRLIAEVNEGKSARGHAVHHKCANRACVNPDHLQICSHQQNLAEMLKRRWYEERIAQLEQALRDVSPSHPMLNTEVA